MWPEPDAAQEARIIHRTLGGNAAFHNFHNDYGHIQDPNQRRRLALSEIDKVPFGWYHVRAVTVAGIGFFTDSYDIFAINFAIQMLGLTFYQGSAKGKVPDSVQTAIKAATSGGAVIGQIGFGWLADMLGRRRMYGIELITIIVSTFAQSLSAPSSAISMTGLLIFWRVIMGIGIGGDYPMSSVITSEFAPTRWRGAMMAAVFSMQGAGQFVAAIISLVVTIGFRDSFTAAKPSDCDLQCRIAADRSWRIIVGTGALPALFALYYRITIPETPRYTFDVAKDIEKANADIQAFKHGQGDGQVDALKQQRSKRNSAKELTQPRASWADFCKYFGNWKNGSLLFATMSSWFFLDLAYYGLGLNNNIVLEAIGYGGSQSTLYGSLFNAAVGNLILVCAGALPGYWMSVFLIDTVGRRPIQIGGFAILTLLLCIIGFAYYSLSQGSLLTLYILAQFFFNFGPNTTTFIIPGECFPTRYRSTAHGLSAASGKIGAVIAQLISAVLLTKDAPAVCDGNQCSPWLPHLMEIFACFMLCGTVVSLLIPETKRKTLEELAGEKPLYQRNSTGPHGSGKSGFLTPVLGVLHSPKLNPLNSKKSNSGKSSEDGNGNSNASVTSEAAILYGHDRTHSSGSDRNYVTNSVARTDGGLFWMESIPLQDVGGLMGGR